MSLHKKYKPDLPGIANVIVN